MEMLLGQGGAAEELYREYVARSKEPESVLILARYLGRQRRLPEALNLCERAFTTCKADLVGSASLAVLHAGQPSEEQFARVERLLREAWQRTTSTTLRICMADLLDLRGRQKEAEELYRRIVKEEPKSVEALNNLAWLLTYNDRNGAEALALANMAIEIAGPLPELLDTRAGAYLVLNEPDLALTDLKDALGQLADSAEIFATVQFHLAQAYIKAGNLAEAKNAFERATKQPGLEAKLHRLEKAGFRQVEALAKRSAD